MPTRRDLLAGGAALVLDSFVRASPRDGAGAEQPGEAAATARHVTVEPPRVISWKPPLYHGWPTLARRTDGELLLAFSGGREAHVCPFGRVELMRSRDEGRTWGWPQVLSDGPIDDRDAGIVETPRGSILVTTFTSLAYVPILEKARAARPRGSRRRSRNGRRRTVGSRSRSAGRSLAAGCSGAPTAASPGRRGTACR